MDDQDIHQEAAASSYSILAFNSQEFPECYLGMILETWARSLRNGNEWFEMIAPIAYSKAYDLIIRNILSKPETTIRVAALTEDPDVAFGYSVHRGSILDYVYVFIPYRHQGIGKMLVPNGIQIYTHITRVGRDIIKKKKLRRKLIFNPFL